ncbi:unnamed protein product [Arabis nemorensis]|uniref:Reverse transcriptase zinc-binding domain-containing protein n=1 Tax=Arabis nemorensis TaxID=586526 RepID=A0A565CD65_9BRAS|nr:unnamed protein product [Arabis nemorensis]
MANLLGNRLSPDWSTTVTRLKNNRLLKMDSQLARMAFQTTIYWIWRERNGRSHQNPTNTASSIARTIHKAIHDRLLSLSHGSRAGDNEAILRWNAVTRRDM